MAEESRKTQRKADLVDCTVAFPSIATLCGPAPVGLPRLLSRELSVVELQN